WSYVLHGKGPVDEATQGKPLARLSLDLIDHLYHLLYGATFLYAAAYGPRIVRLLDSSHVLYERARLSKGQSARLMGGILLLDGATFLCTTIQTFEWRQLGRPLGQL